MKVSLLSSACIWMLLCGAAFASPNQKIQEGAQFYAVSNNANQDLLLDFEVNQQKTQLETIALTLSPIDQNNQAAYYPFQYVINNPASDTTVTMAMWPGYGEGSGAYFDLSSTKVYCVCPNEGSNQVAVCNKATPLLTANATDKTQQEYYQTLCNGGSTVKKGMSNKSPYGLRTAT